MDLTGNIIELTRDWYKKKPILKLMINEEPHGIEDLADKSLKIRITKATKPRSLDANAYFHVLCDKLRQKLGISMARCKNMLITSYGQIEYLDDGNALYYKTNASVDYIEEREEVHLKFVRLMPDGMNMFKVYRGSHTYDTKEMHQLLEGTIQECLAQGDIEVKTPDEIAHIEMLWGKKRGEEYEQHI